MGFPKYLGSKNIPEIKGIKDLEDLVDTQHSINRVLSELLYEALDKIYLLTQRIETMEKNINKIENYD